MMNDGDDGDDDDDDLYITENQFILDRLSVSCWVQHTIVILSSDKE